MQVNAWPSVSRTEWGQMEGYRRVHTSEYEHTNAITGNKVKYFTFTKNNYFSTKTSMN